MSDRKDITRQKFGILTAVKKLDVIKRKRCPTWLFLCECGNYVEYPYDNVVFSNHKGRQSCGCLRKKFYENNKKFLGVTNIEGTCIEHIRSKKPCKRNKSGVKGVCWDKSKKLWYARIMFKKKEYYLGRFKSKKAAIKKRHEAEKMIYGPFLKWYFKNKTNEPKKNMLRGNNTSGYTGVNWQKQDGKWTAEIMVNNKSIFLGVFNKKADAVKARKAAEIKYLHTKLLTIRDMYEKLNIDRSKLRRLLNKLKIEPVVKDGNHVYYKKSTVDKIYKLLSKPISENKRASISASISSRSQSIMSSSRLIS